MKLASFFLLTAACFAQHTHDMAHMHMRRLALQVDNDAAAHVLTLRLGPLNVPAHSDHAAIAQPQPVFFDIPFDGWITAYHPRLNDGAGAALPGRRLHHVAFYNTARPDFLCANKEEHIFGAGGEMNDWPATPGFGYRVQRGDRIRITSMFHNPTDTSYHEAYLQVEIEYLPKGAGELHSVYPAWIDVKECGHSDYDLQPGRNVTSGTTRLDFNGVLIGVGGHMHDYGHELLLTNETTHESVAKLESTLDAEGHILSMPIVRFDDRGGYHLSKGDALKVTATYDNTSGQPLPSGAMAIVVGYFLPDDPAQMSALHRASVGGKN
jgi:hypothetical protein